MLTITRNTLTPNLQQLIKRAPKQVADALKTEAEFIKTDAQKRTPVDTGVLRGSALTHGPASKPGEVSVAITFGGNARDYAIYVHEDLKARHAVGEAKFLERAVLEAAPKLPARIARRLDLRQALR